MILTELARSLDSVSRRRLVLSTHQQGFASRYTDLKKNVAAAKSRLDQQSDVQAVLDSLQRQAHQRAVGSFEQLLTASLRDVLPGRRDLVMDLKIERGLPALDLFIRKAQGSPLEDVLYGAGGSVANVLSVGLRMIALVRSNRRPFLVLDEPDCWIKPDLAPRLAAVIHQAATDLGIQVLMVSHHREDLFEDIIPHRIHLERAAGGLITRRSPTSQEPQWAPEQPGLRSVLLENAMSHARTQLDMAPGVTLLFGENDLGKSVINALFRATFYGGSNDTLIRHHQPFVQATYDFGPDGWLVWRRNRKGRQKVVYSRYPSASQAPGETDEPVDRFVGAKELPAWLDPSFGIGMIEGLDVQLTDQKSPVFLLNQPATHRARALAVGDESRYIQVMMGLDKHDTQDARVTVKHGEQELEVVSRRLRVLERLDQAAPDRTGYDRVAEAVSSTLSAETALGRWQKVLGHAHCYADWRDAPPVPSAPVTPRLQAHLARWQQAQAQVTALHALSSASKPISPPALSQARQSQNVADRWSHASTLSAIYARLAAPCVVAPGRSDGALAKARDLLARWNHAYARHACLAVIDEPAPAPLPATDCSSAQVLLQQWVDHDRQYQVLVDQIQACDHEMTRLSTERETRFPACPTCGQRLPDTTSGDRHDHA